MNNKRTSRRALLTSAMALVLCLVMLVGTTFAWFTDSVTSGVNTIKSGNLDVALSVKNTVGGDFTEVTGTTQVFQNSDKWEPGHVDFAVLKIENLGTLALKYKLGIVAASEKTGVTEDNTVIKLSEHLRYAVLSGDVTTEAGFDRAALLTKVGEGVKLSTVDGIAYYTAEGAESDETVLEVGKKGNDAQLVTLVVWMPTTVGNEANHKTGTEAPSINMGVSLVATQAMKESDSFGDDYDKDADYPVASKDDLKSALDEINNSETTGVNTIVMTDDFTFDNETLEVAKGTVDLDLNGKVLTINSGDLDGVLVKDGATLNLTGGSGKLNIASGAGKAIRLENQAATSDGTTTLNVEDITIDIKNDARVKTAIYAYGENGADTGIVINVKSGAEINVTGDRNFCAIQLANNATLNFDGGVINASGVGSVLVAGRDNAGTDADDILLNFNAGAINITGGCVTGIECNYFATANMNGGQINITGDCDDSYGVGASFGGYININGGTIHVNATSGSACAVATYGNYSTERKSTITIGAGATITLGDAAYNALSDMYPNTVLIDQRG